MRNLVIYGDSAFAERLSTYILAEKTDKLLGFTNDDAYITRKVINGHPVIPFSQLKKTIDCDFQLILGYGYSKMNELRKKIFEECKNAGYVIGSYISSNAICYSENFGEGCILLPNVVIGPGTKIGKCNIFESSVSVSHDSTIGDFNFLSTGVVLGGYTNIHDHCFIGLNSTINSNLEILDYTLIGAGSNVLSSTEVGRILKGNPAKAVESKFSKEVII